MDKPEPTILFPMTLIRAGGLPLAAWAPFGMGMPDWAAVKKDEVAGANRVLEAFDMALQMLEDSPLRTMVYNARKDFYQRRKAPASEIQQRFSTVDVLAPLLDTLSAYQAVLAQKLQAEALFEQRLAAQLEALQGVALDETLQRALLFASHDLLASLPSFVQKPVSQFDKKERRTAFSLLQYFTRALFKTAPLGRFTTVQICALSAVGKPEERVGEWHLTKSLVSPNVALLPAMYEVLLQEPAFFTSLSLCLNPCITASDPATKLGGWLYFDGEREAFQQIEPDAVAEWVVDTLLSRERKLPYAELKALLEDAVAATEDQLQALITRLVDIGLLEWQLPELGLAPNWCSGLYNYLGYLPSSPVLTEAAYLLQWLRTAARTLPFQSQEAAQNLQQETNQALNAFFDKHGARPLIPLEQLFFEDVAREVALDLPPGTLEQLTAQLAVCWNHRKDSKLSPFRWRLLAFAEEQLEAGAQINFLAFARAFLENIGQGMPAKQPLATASPKKLGALLQVYKAEGAYKAVVNAMYPGGGKLFARWLPLFPSECTTALQQWQSADPVTVAFPWQGWTNANFQPTLASMALTVPDGRTKGGGFLLGDLLVRRTAQGMITLVDARSGQEICFNDLGLEAPETRPPVMQVLWHLGMPMVSSDALLPDYLIWEQQGEVRHRRRVEAQSLVLARSAWELPVSFYASLFPKSLSQAARMAWALDVLQSLGLPTRFFGQFTARRERPQFYDMGSPISMMLLEKNVRGGAGSLLLTEMLPMPEQWLGENAAEFVVEWSV